MTIDPRANSEQKIDAPWPLPHVSRRALKRCKDSLPPPTECRYCTGNVEIVSNSRVYGREYGDWPYLYLCECCGAYVGLHPDTDLPLGTLADGELREARKTNKAHFVELMRVGRNSRKSQYQWLAKRLSIPASECHWGMFDIDMCEQAGLICRQQLDILNGTGG